MTCVAKYDFSIPQGTDLSVPFRLKDSEGVPVRLEGFSVRMQLRRFVTASDVIDELSTENGRVTLDDNGGGFSLSFPNGVTEKFPSGYLVYDIELVSPDDLVTRIVEGKIRVTAEVTRGEV